jgi:haloalkane dehalogenase
MEILRTPDERFVDLKDYSFAPNYVEVDGLRIHFVDEGDKNAEPVLMLHGEPSWSYLYRKMIPLFVQAGYRAVAPDLVGFGKSDKLGNRTDYTYQKHVDWMTGWLKAVDLKNVTLVCQDWGGLIGLRLVAENPDRFARVVAANTFLPTGDQPPSEAFLRWQKFSQEVPQMHVGGIVKGGTVNKLTDEEVAAYDAPYPEERYKEGARQFPLLVPTRPDDPASAANRKAWEVLYKWEKPFLTAFSDSDPVTRGGDRVLQKLIPGTQGQPHTTIVGGGHFLQEDKGAELAQATIAFMKQNPL